MCLQCGASQLLWGGHQTHTFCVHVFKNRRERERERERETDRQTDRQIDRQTEWGRDGEGERVRQADRQTDRQTDRQSPMIPTHVSTTTTQTKMVNHASPSVPGVVTDIHREPILCPIKQDTKLLSPYWTQQVRHKGVLLIPAKNLTTNARH